MLLVVSCGSLTVDTVDDRGYRVRNSKNQSEADRINLDAKLGPPRVRSEGSGVFAHPGFIPLRRSATGTKI